MLVYSHKFYHPTFEYVILEYSPFTPTLMRKIHGSSTRTVSIDWKIKIYYFVSEIFYIYYSIIY